MKGYVITSDVDPSALPDPLAKTVVTASRRMAEQLPPSIRWLKAVPALGFAGGLLTLFAAALR